MAERKTETENPLTNLLVNVIVPVLILSYLSKDPVIQEKLGREARPWHLGPMKAMILALALPLGFGIRYFLKTRQTNFISVMGLISVLCSGLLTLYLWNADGSVKPNAGWWFGLKEGLVPLILGVIIWFSRKGEEPMVKTFLFNDALFAVEGIERRVKERGEWENYRGLLTSMTGTFALSFFLSALLNVGLAAWFFRGFDEKAIDALEKYNGIVARLTGWGFAVIGVPLMVFFFLIFRRLMGGLRGLTGMKDEELLLPR